MKSGSAPPAPNFNRLAERQADLQNQAVKFNQQNPFGSMTWNQDDQGNWTSSTNLTPEQQFLFDRGQKAQMALADRSPAYAQMLGDMLSSPVSGGGDVRGRVEAELLGKLNTQSDQDLESLRSRLLNQGITENSEAWRRQMSDFDANRQNARTSALLNAGQEASRQVGLETGLRSQYLNEMAAMLGQTGPTIPQYQVNAGAAPDIYGAAQDQYAAQMQDYNAKRAMQAQMLQGAGQLAGTGMMALAMSDARLKSNIVQVGSDPRGFGIYEYDIADRRERGVLAQEVEAIVPKAVVEVDGIKHVSYGLLGIEREVLNG